MPYIIRPNITGNIIPWNKEEESKLIKEKAEKFSKEEIIEVKEEIQELEEKDIKEKNNEQKEKQEEVKVEAKRNKKRDKAGEE